MEIVYCVDCGKKLRDHDFVRGAAYTRDKRHYCTTCRPLNAPASQAPARSPKPKTTRAAALKPAGPKSKVLVAVIAGGVLLAGAVIAVIASSAGNPAPPTEETLGRESAARDAVRRAREFETSNPKDREGHVQAWKQVLPVCEKTAYAKEAKQSLDRAVAALEKERTRLEAAKKALGPPPTATWDFERLSGDVFRNSGGDLYGAVRMPGVDQVEGVIGKGLRFNGKSYVRIDGADMFNAPDLTVTLWIKPAGVKGRQGLISKRTDSKQSPFVLSLWEGALAFEAADPSHEWPIQMRSVALVKAEVWSHVAVVARSGHGVHLYLNGMLLQEFKLDRPRCRNSDPVFVGREMFNGTDAHDGTATFTGLIDEINVWTQPLGAAEIKAQYDAAVPSAKER
jgi:hypothetical protein